MVRAAVTAGRPFAALVALAVPAAARAPTRRRQRSRPRATNRSCSEGPDRRSSRARATGSRCASGPISSSRSRSATGCGRAPRSRSRPPASRRARAASVAATTSNPTVSAKIVLSPSPDGGAALSAARRRPAACSASSGARTETTTARSRSRTPRRSISDLSALPCPPDACYVDLIVGATSKKSKKGDVVVLGADPPRSHGPAGQGPAERRPGPVEGAGCRPSASSEALVNTQLPLTEGKQREAPRRLLGADPRPAARARSSPSTPASPPTSPNCASTPSSARGC